MDECVIVNINMTGEHELMAQSNLSSNPIINNTYHRFSSCKGLKEEPNLFGLIHLFAVFKSQNKILSFGSNKQSNKNYVFPVSNVQSFD